MKAAWYKEFGEARNVLNIGDWPEPEPKQGEVKVRIRASGVNPSDTKKRAGANPALLENGPVIPNSDGAGEIVGVGNDVSESRIGERVWLYNGQFGRQEGTSTEYICLPSAQAVYLPSSASFEAGAIMGIPAMTAHRCVFADGDVGGKIILVTGGSGRVGYYAIQWGKEYGATVIATASSESSIAECKKAGADLVVAHPSDDTTKQILEFTGGQKVDRVVEGDFGVNLLHNLNVLGTNGVIATYSSMTDQNPRIPFVQMMFMDITVRMVIVYAMPDQAKQDAIRDITKMLEGNKFVNRILGSYGIDDIASAHEAIESGKGHGSVIINLESL